jgi:hypothetical protein
MGLFWGSIKLNFHYDSYKNWIFILFFFFNFFYKKITFLGALLFVCDEVKQEHTDEAVVQLLLQQC